jgi:hypothetical protein
MRYKYPNEEHFGKEVYSEIERKCTAQEKEDIAQVLTVAKYVFNYTGSQANADKNVGALDNYYHFYEEFEATSVKYKIKLVTTWNNGETGYIWVVYSVEGFDKNGNGVYGSWDVLSRWEIEMKNNRWEVVQIDEAP